MTQQVLDHAQADDAINQARTSPRPDAVARFETCLGSVFPALFAGGLFDQVALPAVAAGVEETGRVRYDTVNRAARSAASEQLTFLADDQVRRREADRLLRLHRDVKGIGYNGVRYSALNPESWNWVLVSTFLMHRGATQAITGTRFDADDDQAIWEFYLQLSDPLQLPGSGRLPDTFAEMMFDYERILSEKCEPNKTLDGAVESLRRPRAPDGLPFLVRTILWPVPMAVIGEMTFILGLGVLHPGIRDLIGVPWTGRRRLEYRVLTKVVQLANGHLPKRITMSPMARNRQQYERLVAKYEGLGLSSFAPDHEPARCPIG